MIFVFFHGHQLLRLVNSKGKRCVVYRKMNTAISPEDLFHRSRGFHAEPFPVLFSLKCSRHPVGLIDRKELHPFFIIAGNDFVFFNIGINICPDRVNISILPGRDERGQ